LALATLCQPAFENLRGNEQSISVMVTNVSETSATVDANHPLAGKDLTFHIQLVAIV